MNIENEKTILDIDKKEFVAKLLIAGAKEVCPERKQIRCVYDIDPNNKNKWMRLRTNGEKTTLTIKEISNNSKVGAKEIEIEVSDFEETNKILEELGYHARNRQENLRHIFEIDGAEVSIDTWPMIPPYAEIEAEDLSQIENVLNTLDVDRNKTTKLDVVSIYNEIYGIDVMAITDLRLEDKNGESMLECNK